MATKKTLTELIKEANQLLSEGKVKEAKAILEDNINVVFDENTPEDEAVKITELTIKISKAVEVPDSKEDEKPEGEEAPKVTSESLMSMTMKELRAAYPEVTATKKADFVEKVLNPVPEDEEKQEPKKDTRFKKKMPDVTPKDVMNKFDELVDILSDIDVQERKKKKAYHLYSRMRNQVEQLGRSFKKGMR